MYAVYPSARATSAAVLALVEHLVAVVPTLLPG